MAGFGLRTQGFGLCLILFLTGATLSMIGPSLPDLALLHGVDLGTLAHGILLFTGAGIVGNLLTPILLKRVSIYQLLAAMALLNSVFYFVVPFTGNVYVLFVAITLAGAATFPLFNVVFLKTSMLWPNNPRPYYVAMEASALGAVVGPLVLAPFLSDGVFTRNLNSKALSPNSQSINTISNRTSDANLLVMDVDTFATPENRTDGVAVTSMGIPYAVFGALSIPIVIQFYCFHNMEKSVQITVADNSDYEPIDDDVKTTSRSVNECVLIAFMFVYFLDGLVHTSFGSLLPTYGTKRLNMSTDVMSFMTSMYWFAFLLGRLVPCFLSSKFKQFPIVVVGNVGMCVAFVCVVLAMRNKTMLWISTFLAGMFYGPRLPANLAWSKKLVEDTPRIVSLKFVSAGIGSMYSYVVDVVMTRVDYDAFVYMFIGMHILNVSMLLCIILLCKFMKIKVCV